MNYSHLLGNLVIRALSNVQENWSNPAYEGMAQWAQVC